MIGRVTVRLAFVLLLVGCGESGARAKADEAAADGRNTTDDTSTRALAEAAGLVA